MPASGRFGGATVAVVGQVGVVVGAVVSLTNQTGSRTVLASDIASTAAKAAFAVTVLALLIVGRRLPAGGDRLLRWPFAGLTVFATLSTVATALSAHYIMGFPLAFAREVAGLWIQAAGYGLTALGLAAVTVTLWRSTSLPSPDAPGPETGVPDRPAAAPVT